MSHCTKLNIGSTLWAVSSYRIATEYIGPCFCRDTYWIRLHPWSHPPANLPQYSWSIHAETHLALHGRKIHITGYWKNLFRKTFFKWKLGNKLSFFFLSWLLRNWYQLLIPWRNNFSMDSTYNDLLSSLSGFWFFLTFKFQLFTCIRYCILRYRIFWEQEECEFQISKDLPS